MRSLENGRNVIIKAEDKGSAIVVWDRLNYLAEAENLMTLTPIRRLKNRERTRKISCKEQQYV